MGGRQGTNAGRYFHPRAGILNGGGLVERKKVCNSAKFSGDAASKPPRKPPGIDSKVEAELRRLQKATKGAIPDERRAPLLPMLRNLAFLKVKLDEARRDLMFEPIYTEYDNGGGQSGLREHPGFSAYNKLFTTYSREVGKLAAMMPSGSSAADELVDFINSTRYG